jgi:cytidylate kinase
MKIAIDGPAGVGKSTVAKLLAERFDLTYINTGAMYRGVAYLSLNDPNFDLDHIRNINMEFQGDKLLINGVDVSDKIFNEKIDKISSTVSQNPNIRKVLTKIQKEMANRYDNIVMEGRDIGTVVIPNADFKFFLTASIEERARRRMKQNELKGIKSDFESLKKAIEKRDYEDTNRENAPLRKADDAIEIDTTNLSIDEVIDKISQFINRRQK